MPDRDASRSEGCVPVKTRSTIGKLGQYDLDVDLIPSHTYGAAVGGRVSMRYGGRGPGSYSSATGTDQ